MATTRALRFKHPGSVSGMKQAVVFGQQLRKKGGQSGGGRSVAWEKCPCCIAKVETAWEWGGGKGEMLVLPSATTPVAPPKGQAN